MLKGPSNVVLEFTLFEVCSYVGAVFDASQYEFFGNDAVEEVELGGLEDEEDDVAPAGYEEEEFIFDAEQVAF